VGRSSETRAATCDAAGAGIESEIVGGGVETGTGVDAGTALGTGLDAGTALGTGLDAGTALGTGPAPAAGVAEDEGDRGVPHCWQNL
jgi:hypothetical protein